MRKVLVPTFAVEGITKFIVAVPAVHDALDHVDEEMIDVLTSPLPNECPKILPVFDLRIVIIPDGFPPAAIFPQFIPLAARHASVLVANRRGWQASPVECRLIMPEGQSRAFSTRHQAMPRIQKAPRS